MSFEYTQLGTATIRRKAYAPKFALKCLGLASLVGVFAVIHALSKPRHDGLDEMADTHGDTFPARVLPSRHTCRGGSPFAAPAFIPEDDGFETAYADGEWLWDHPADHRILGDD